MGSFFTNVQLQISDLEKSEITDRVIESITKFNTEAGFIKVDSEEEADKTVIIAASGHSNWIAVYDEDTEGEGSRKLNKLTAALSKELKTTALSILVSDSDYMYVGLHKNGTLKDTISNLSKEIDFRKNKPSVWTEILAENYTFDDIENAWQKNIFAEEFLTPFARFTNLDHSKLLTGYEYLSEEKPDEGIKLNFARKDKKETVELGLTQFSLISGRGRIDIKRDENQTTEWMLTNYGTFSNGLDIVIAGKCIEEGLIIPEIAKVSHVKYKSENQPEIAVPFTAAKATTGEKIFYVRVEDIFIPKGFRPTYPMTPKEGKRYGKIWYDSAIKFDISFIGGEEGSGDFTIFFSPLANRQDGSYAADVTRGTMEEWLKQNSL